MRACLVCVALVLASTVTLADPPPDASSPQAGLDVQNLVQQLMPGASAAGPKATGGLPDFEEVTKDMKASPGLFTLWSYPEGAKDKDTEKLLCQIPASFLGQQFMLSTSFSGGGFFTGFPLDQHVVRWELLGNQLLLVEPDTRYTTPPGKETTDVVQRTYPERIRAAVPLVTKSPSGDPVIDLGPLLKSNFADIAWTSYFGDVGGGLANVNPSLSKWTKKKAFELNVEIGVALAMNRMSPPGSYDKKLVHFSFWKLPKTDYTPRVGDQRVGYFMTALQDWSKPTSSRELFDRYVDRWNLVKRDPSLTLSEPRQPIVFYIEKTVPIRFRRAVRDGILEWNKAFEKCGFVNAIEVRQQTDDNEWRDLDPEDMRYSFFRWIVTGAGFAMGPHRSNPYTGEIYDADIIFDDSMVRFYEQEAQRDLSAAALELKLSDPVLEQFFARFPQFRRPVGDWRAPVLTGVEQEEAQLRAVARERIRQRGLHVCDYAQGMKHQLAVAHAAVSGAPPEVIDRLLYDVVKEVVMHEVGHTLGLRHNFKASSIYSVEEIKRRRMTGEATVGSVMDYNPTLIFSENTLDGHFITPTLGPYDYWAIEYGYKPFDGQAMASAAPPKPEATPKGEDGADDAAKSDGEDADKQPAAVAVKGPEVTDEMLAKVPPEMREQVKSMIQNLPADKADKVGKTPTGAKNTGQPAMRKAPAGEAAMLQQIASRANEPELAYATDEDTSYISVDPRSNRFDMGANPIDWARERINFCNQRLATILDWAVRDQESWYFLRPAFLSLMMEKTFTLDYVGRYIGGQYFHRSHRGDPNASPPFVLVDAKMQRDALGFIEQELFTDKFFDVSPEVLNHLAPHRWWTTQQTPAYRVDFPVREYISMMQWWNLFDRLYPDLLMRIHDAEMKTTEADRLTVAEYIQRLQSACWSDAVDVKRLNGKSWTHTEPFISDVRRSLQREYLGIVEPLVRFKPGVVLSPDVHAMLCSAMRSLSGEIEAILKAGKLDFASQAHLQSCRQRIERMLSPELKEYEAAMVGF